MVIRKAYNRNEDRDLAVRVRMELSRHQYDTEMITVHVTKVVVELVLVVLILPMLVFLMEILRLVVLHLQAGK